MKVIVIGINKAGHNLIGFPHHLVNRIDVIHSRAIQTTNTWAYSTRAPTN